MVLVVVAARRRQEGVGLNASLPDRLPARRQPCSFRDATPVLGRSLAPAHATSLRVGGARHRVCMYVCACVLLAEGAADRSGSQQRNVATPRGTLIARSTLAPVPREGARGAYKRHDLPH